MARLAAHHWIEIRRQWETAPDTGFHWMTQAGGGIWPVSRETVRVRAKSEEWTKRPSGPSPSAAAPGGDPDGIAGAGDSAAGDVAGGVFDADFSIEDLAPGDGLEAVRDRLLVLHRRDWVALRRLASAAVVEGTIEAARRVEHQARMLRLVQMSEVPAFGLDAAQMNPDAMSEQELQDALRGRRPRP